MVAGGASGSSRASGSSGAGGAGPGPGRLAGPPARPPGGLSTLTRLAFLGGPMLSMIDSSVVNIAVPDIVAGLHTSLGTAAWTVSGYLLGLAAGLAITPWLARRFGTLPAYQAALAGFIVASACCALAPNVGVLIATRVLQGLAGAPMVPLAMGLLLGRGNGGARTMPVSAAAALRGAGARPGHWRPADQRVRLAVGFPDQPPDRDRRMGWRAARAPDPGRRRRPRRPA